jgi:aspartate/glutamate racemase
VGSSLKMIAVLTYFSLVKIAKLPMPVFKILIVDDEVLIAEYLKDILFSLNMGPLKMAHSREQANKLIDAGVEGVILGCTELTLFMPLDCKTILFDTTQIHIEDALDMALV